MSLADQKKKLIYAAYRHREDQKKHHTYEADMFQYQLIKQGDPRSIEVSQAIFMSNETGKLSEDALRNCKYLFVAAMTLTTRACIEGGLEPEEAYYLSDLYIQQADTCQTRQHIHDLHKVMVEDMTKRMSQLTQKTPSSKSIKTCLAYIYDNLHMTITIETLAKHVQMSPNYLATLFKSEMGTSLASYIRSKRIETAKNMLRYSDLSIIDISNTLAFSSMSHFIKVFKAHTGVTPKVYRNHSE